MGFQLFFSQVLHYADVPVLQLYYSTVLSLRPPWLMCYRRCGMTSLPRLWQRTGYLYSKQQTLSS